MENALSSAMRELYAFLQTVTIFNDYAYDFHRKQLIKYTGLTTIAPLENPYIVQMLGEYYTHPDPTFTEYNDVPIYIVSHDTPGVSILLSRSSLEDHPITWSNYRSTPSLFHGLLARYPDRSHFIKSCFFPVELDQLIDLNTGNLLDNLSFTLLAHGADVTLPPRERVDMVDKLKGFLHLFEENVNIPAYIKFEEYAPTVLYSMLWSLLPLVLLNRRIENIFTPRAHQDLIWLYLTSNGLSDYRDVLTDEQEFFLYRNLRFLKTVQGSNQSIRMLLDNLLKPVGLFLVAKQLMLDDTTVLETGKPTPFVVNKSLQTEGQFETGSSFVSQTLPAFFETEQLSKLETTKGPHPLSEQQNILSLSRSTRLPSKMYELLHPKYSTRKSIAYVEFMVETLLYWLSITDSSGRPIIDFNVELTDSFNFTKMLLPIREALALYYYAEVQQRAATIEITPDNVSLYYGKTIRIEDELIHLNETNADFYYNRPGLLVGPTHLPTSGVLTKPFIPGAVAEVNTFKHRGQLFNIDQLVVDTPRNRVISSAINSTDRLTQAIDEEFSVRLADVMLMEDTQDVLIKEAYWRLYKSTVYTGNCVFNWGDVSAYASMEDWIESNPTLGSHLSRLETTQNRALAFETLATDILTSIINPLLSSYFSLKETSTLKASLMNKLLGQLSTYDVAYLTTNAETVAADYTGDIYSDSAYPWYYSVMGVVPMFDFTRQAYVIGVLDKTLTDDNNEFLWREDDSFTVVIPCSPNDSQAKVAVVSDGSAYCIEEDVIIADPITKIDIEPNLNEQVSSRSSASFNSALQSRHIDPIIATSDEVPVKTPYPENISTPPEDDPIPTEYDYDLLFDGTLGESLTPAEVSVSMSLGGGRLLSIQTETLSTRCTLATWDVFEEVHTFRDTDISVYYV